MASKTTNYNLDMPAYNEIADIDVINGNMDKIDVQMKKNADSAQQSKDIVSDEYSATNMYAVGDYCIRENVLYKCKTAITTGEAFDSSKWVQTTCGTEFRELNSNLAQLDISQVDIKMLGWSVPKECPIQNEVNGNQFVQKVGRVALNSLGWSYVSAHNLFFANVNDNKEKYSMNFVITKSGYSKVKVYYTIAPDKSCGFIVDTVRQFAIKDSAYTDLSSFVAAMKGEYLYYELATPITRTIGGNEAVTQIKNDLEWKLLADNVAVGTSTNVVSGAREYYVVAKYVTINITTLIPSIVLGKTIFDGHYSSASDNSRIQINTTTSALSLVSFIYGGSVKDDATYSVYYR